MSSAVTDCDLAQHVAGAIVRHESPFATLDVPRSGEPMDPRFQVKWCDPFYLMDTAIVRASDVADLRSVWREIDESVATRLLADVNWRPRVVGALFVALKALPLVDVIGRLLLRSDVCYAGRAYCHALAAANDEAARGYLGQYLDYYLRQPRLHFDQGEAMGAIAVLDRANGTDILSAYLPAWEAFVADKPSWSLEKSIEMFRRQHDGIHALRVACAGRT